MRPTVGDIDLLVAAADSQAVMRAFSATRTWSVSWGRGATNPAWSSPTACVPALGPPAGALRHCLQYATGSKDHNVRLRELALKQGLSLSEHSLERKDGGESLCARRGRGLRRPGLALDPARAARGPRRSAGGAGQNPAASGGAGGIRSELHTHSTWSDGKLSILEMAQAARQRGIQLLAISDHSFSLGVAGGMTVEDVRRQRQEIHQAQRQLGDSIRLIQGAEVEMRADGSLDFPDEVLAELDIVCASLHTGLRQPRKKVTERTLNAIRNPHVDMIGHPTGRMIPDREGADLDMDAVLSAAAETDCSGDQRPSLPPRPRRRLCPPGDRHGDTASINTDAHAASDLDLLHFGVSTARRGWVTAESVINTWQPERLLAWLKDRD